MFRKGKKWLGMVAVLILLIIVGIGIIKFLPARPLTTEQKLEDFNYLYDVLIEHQPMLEEYKEVIGFDFEGNKEYYEELIRNTKDDYEFFVIMNMIMEDFPSAHTGVNIESFDEIEQSGHTYSKELKKAFGGRDRSEYWQEHFVNYMVEDKEDCLFEYYDGKYISHFHAFDLQEERTLILLAINDEPIDEYILRKEVNGKLGYDKYNDKVYRHTVWLNLKYGQLVKATFQNGNGEIFEREVYIRNKDCAFEGKKIESADIPEVDKPLIPEVKVMDIQSIKGEAFCVTLDKARNLSYVLTYNFSDKEMDEELVVDAMQKACENDNIILDLRNNEGGYREYFMKNIYPSFFKSDISVSTEYYLNKITITSKLDNKETTKFRNINLAEEYLENIVKIRDQYNGKGNGKEDKNVYVLISNTTYSAADWAAATLKEYTNAVVIGTNTGGEGLGGTAFYDIMPNSKMTFMVQDSQSFNEDGTDNSIYGTSPDYYIPHTFNSITKRNQLLSEKVLIYDYENRLKWDNVLIETIEMINGEEP